MGRRKPSTAPKKAVDSEVFDVCFVWPYFGRTGGVETWHKALLPRLELSSVIATQRPSGLDVNSIYSRNVQGNYATRQAIAQSKVVVAAAIERIDLFLPKDNRPRVIYVDHGDGSIPYFEKLFHQNRQVADTFICVHEAVAERYRAYHHDVRVIANGIDPMRVAKRRTPTELKYVAWVHRKAPEKRPELAYAIAEQLPDGWQMVMTCDGEDSAKVRHVGVVANPRHLYSVASVFLSTSNSDGFGLSCAEAMLSGVPVVASPIGICADPDLAIQVDVNAPVADWVEAIENAHKHDTAKAKAIVESRCGVDAFVSKWREVICEPNNRSDREQ